MSKVLQRLVPATALSILFCGACPTPVASAGATGGPASQPAAFDVGAGSELSTLDSRRPVPLQPTMAWHQKQNMMEHLAVIQRVTAGLATEDWKGIEVAAAAIGSSPQMKQTCQHMGAGADGFTEMALDFHERADAIAAAAQTHDRTAVLGATAHTLAACVRCHATYRQDVVDAATWAQRTGTAHDAQPSSQPAP